MTDLVETPIWPDGIYQIETTDPVLGGPPNLQTKAGLSNIQAQQLAHRTAFLKAALGGIGGVAENASDLNALAKSGIFLFAAGAIGNPVGGVNGAVIHAESDDGDAWQFAVSANGKSYSRVRADDTPTWTNWRHIIDDQGGLMHGQLVLGGQIEAQTLAKIQINGFLRVGGSHLYSHEGDDFLAPLVPGSSRTLVNREADGRLAWDNSPVWTDKDGARFYAPNGYERLPTGLIIQWAMPTGADGDSFTFPITFPSRCAAVLPVEAHPTAVINLCADTISASGFTLRAYRIDINATSDAISQFQYIAIGY